MAKEKTFLCRYEVNTGLSDLPFFHLAEGKSAAAVTKEHEVEQDSCGLDTEDSPIGGAEGQYSTCLMDVIPITPAQKKFLNKIGIH